MVRWRYRTAFFLFQSWLQSMTNAALQPEKLLLQRTWVLRMHKQSVQMFARMSSYRTCTRASGTFQNVCPVHCHFSSKYYHSSTYSTKIPDFLCPLRKRAMTWPGEIMQENKILVQGLPRGKFSYVNAEGRRVCMTLVSS